MPSLLISLGTTWAVVPEAFGFLSTDASGFTRVHVLTTDSPQTDKSIAEVKDWFVARHSDVKLTFTRVNGFADLRSETDHFNFEEVLYRWFLAAEPSPSNRYVCLAGGFKTMSSAMQKAAAVLGAAEVFHVLADPSVNTAEKIDTAISAGDVRFIPLGSESGWPQFRTVSTAEYPLTAISENGAVRIVRAPDSRFRNRLREVTERSHRIAGAWSRLAELPFTELATWQESDLAWLNEPLDPESQIDQTWIRSLPKLDLHCHLGGFATHGAHLEVVRAAAEHPDHLPSLLDVTPPQGWPLSRTPCDLNSYMKLGDNNGSAILRDRGCLRAQCRLLYDHFLSERIIYSEVRCSPNNYASLAEGRSALDVLSEIRNAFQESMDAARIRRSSDSSAPEPCHVNLIMIATRRDGGDRSDISRHLSLAVTAADQWQKEADCRIVGVDLAGFENKETRAALFATDFEPVHRVGLAVTIHAGENDDAEGIWQAVFKLNARRLGHALRLGESPDLLRAVADRRIAVEMCPYANYQIHGFQPMENHADFPLKEYLDAGVPVTVNTDNIGISRAGLTDNILFLAKLCPTLTRLDILKLLRNAAESAFVLPEQRRNLLTRMVIQPPST